MKIIKITLLFIFLSFPFFNLYAKHNILILNSYHQTLAWTDSIVKTILNNFKNENFYIEYMDTKRFNRERIFKIFKNYLKEKYKNKKIDIIVVTDNNALTFIVEHRKQLFKKVPVIFCGINNFRYEMLKGYKDITGVTEGVDIKGTVDTILTLQPKIKKIVAIMGANFTSQLYFYRILNIQYAYRDKVDIFILNGLFYNKKDLTEELHNIPKNSVILYLNLFKLRDGTLFGIKDSVNYVFENTHKPIYVMWDVMMNFPGVVGGKITSSRLQALEVVRYLKKILYQHISPEKLGITLKPPTEYIFDYKELKRFGIDINNFNHPYRLINKPPAVYEELKKTKHLLLYAKIILLIFGILMGFLIYNIRKRKIFEKRLKSENIQFLTLLNSMLDIVVMKTPDDRWIYANKVAKNFFKFKKDEEYFGKTTDEILGKLPFKRSSFVKYVNDDEVWKRKEPVRFVQTLIDLNDKSLYIDILKIPVFNDDGSKKCMIITGKDITEYRKLQENMIITQKMDIVGKLAGGVAHDFNNVLTVILNNAELCKMRIKEDDKIFKYIENIILASERAGLLVRHLLTFAKRDIDSSGENKIELNSTIKSIIKIIKPLIPENIKMVYESINQSVVITGNDIQIEQIITNLAINARDAVLDSDKKEKIIKISVKKVLLDEKFFKKIDKDFYSGEYALIEIEDNGIGIPENIKDKIFEPFFTTKSDKRGTGLGLSTVKELVEKNKGFILVTSKEKKGSIFRIYFPTINSKSIINKYNKKFEEKEILNEIEISKNVLFVEDNINIIKSIPDYFKNKFKNFIIAENGLDAIKKIKGIENDIDILITDIVMPEMDGIELAKNLKNINKDIKIIFVSGYESGKLNNINFEYKFLYKPYKFESILSIICEFFK